MIHYDVADFWCSPIAWLSLMAVKLSPIAPGSYSSFTGRFLSLETTWHQGLPIYVIFGQRWLPFVLIDFASCIFLLASSPCVSPIYCFYDMLSSLVLLKILKMLHHTGNVIHSAAPASLSAIEHLQICTELQLWIYIAFVLKNKD